MKKKNRLYRRTFQRSLKILGTWSLKKEEKKGRKKGEWRRKPCSDKKKRGWLNWNWRKVESDRSTCDISIQRRSLRSIPNELATVIFDCLIRPGRIHGKFAAQSNFTRSSSASRSTHAANFRLSLSLSLSLSLARSISESRGHFHRGARGCLFLLSSKFTLTFIGISRKYQSRLFLAVHCAPFARVTYRCVLDNGSNDSWICVLRNSNGNQLLRYSYYSVC